MTIQCGQVEGFVGGFVGVLCALYRSLDKCHRMCLGERSICLDAFSFVANEVQFRFGGDS